MLTRTSCGLPLALAASVLFSSATHAQATASAASFIDSVGVNVHLASQESAYGDLPRIRSAIRQLGVKHIRDGLLNTNVEDYYTGLTLLARDGVHALLYTDVSQSTAMLRSFRARVPGSLEGIEAPSELDATSDLWLKELREAQTRMTQATSGTELFTVGPALTRRLSFATFGTEPCRCTFGNLHNYFGGQNPGTEGREETGAGSYPWTLQLARSAFGTLPLITTESGYVTDSAKANGLPDEVAGRYTVRLLLEQFLHGIQRTYLYELIDMEVPDRGISDHDGLMRADFTPRPSFLAVSALLKVLQDPARLSDDQTAQPATNEANFPQWKIGKADRSIHHLGLRKSNGDTALILWREVPGYAPETKRPIPVAPVDVELHLEPQTRASAMHFAADGSLANVVPGIGTQRHLMVDDAPTIVLLEAAPRARTPSGQRSTSLMRDRR